MANKLKTFDFDAPTSLAEPGEKASYPWDQWFDGDIWELVGGEDFTTHPLMMERIIRTRASSKSHKAKVSLRHIPKAGDPQYGDIVLQRMDIVGPTAAHKMELAERRRAKREADTAAAEEIVKDIKSGKRNTTAAKRTAQAKEAARPTPSKRAARPAPTAA